MSERLTETAAEVAAEIPRYSWELMDEDQRDDLMKKVVLPRHGKVTSDGVTLTYNWWADTLGTTYSTVEQRIKRLRAKKSDNGGSSQAKPTRSQKSQIRGARWAIREHPELAGEVLMDPEVREAVTDHIASDSSLTSEVVSKRQKQVPKPAPEPKQQRDYNGLIDRAINDIMVALAAERGGEFELSQRNRALLYFLAQHLADRLPPSGEVETDAHESDFAEIERHANTGASS